MNLCDDNRTATIEAAKMALIKGTNIEDSPEEMKVLDSFLLRCWQMGWLYRYEPPRHFNAMPKETSERMAAGHGSNVPMQPNIPPMPSNTSNALDALVDAYKGRSNALENKRTNEHTETHGVCLDTISRQDAIEVVQNRPMMLNKEKVLLINDLEKLPPAEPKRETTTLRIGRTRNSVTMWYECAECGEPVDQEDAFCRRCGRGIIHG